MPFADWIISSRAWTTQSITIDGSPEDVTAPAGGLYLVHPTSSLDALARLVVAMTSAGVADPAAFITEDRYVRLTSSGTFDITWGSATWLRDLLGFTGDLSGASSYTAPNRSPLLWSPGKRLSSLLSPGAARGQAIIDVSATIGAQGNIVVRQEGSPTYKQNWKVSHVPAERYQSTPPTHKAGEFTGFWLTELTLAQRFIVLRRVGEGTSSTTSASYGSSTKVGPYRYDMTERSARSLPFKRAAGFERVDGPSSYYDVDEIPAIECTEFS